MGRDQTRISLSQSGRARALPTTLTRYHAAGSRNRECAAADQADRDAIGTATA